MKLLTNTTFQKYFVPGIVFQSCVIAGGYGTGRELVEYFMGYGPVKGTLAMCIVTLGVWSGVAALTYCFAVLYQKFTYKELMKELMGPGWVLFEISYIFLVLIILAVVTAAAGAIVAQLVGISKWFGIIGMATLVFLLVVSGSELIEKVLSVWSFVLYGVYILFLILVFVNYGDQIAAAYAGPQGSGAWALGGFKYAFYNLGVVLAVIYTVKHCETGKEAFISGLISGLIGVLPGIMLFIGMCGFYPEIISEELPINYILTKMHMPWMQWLFQIVLFGTLIETGSGMIYAITDRVETAIRVKGGEVKKWLTPVIALIMLAVGCGIASFGLTALIAKGYGTIAWIMFFVYVIPICTLGIYKIRKKYKEAAALGIKV
ncbi:MAG: hypothetical protein ACOYJH_05865 [Anaerovoracaceae bacterium]|jgi:uncharacterized membrane protein YkvI